MAIEISTEGETQMITDGVEAGRARRADLPRSEHGRWQPAADRRDPVAILEEQGETRVEELLPIRY